MANRVATGMDTSRVAVFRALQLGDMLCAVPALRALRAALPDSKIVLIGLPWASTFFDRYRHYVDEFVPFPGWPGLPEQWPEKSRIPKFLSLMRRSRFDLAIQLHGSGTITNPLVTMFGAKQVAGFHIPGEFKPDSLLFTAYPDKGLEVHRLLKLIEFLGISACGDHLEFPIREHDCTALSDLASASGMSPYRYACIHPGASHPARRWSAEHFAVVGNKLSRLGLQVVITGTLSESDLCHAMRVAVGSNCINLCGKTDLGALAALLNDAELLVCNDTGVSHLSDALRVPSIVLSTGDNPDRWAPFDRDLHHILAPAQEVAPQDVLDRAKTLLTRYAARPRNVPARVRLPGMAELLLPLNPLPGEIAL